MVQFQRPIWRVQNRPVAGGPVGDIFRYSAVVRAGHQVWVSGAAPYGRDGQLVGPGQPYDQTKQCLLNISEALRKVGATLADVVVTRIYALDAKAWREIGRAHGEAFHEVQPAATFIEVRGLLGPGMLVEIEAEALINGD